MSDAWEILVEHSTAGDAWERLNSITSEGATPGSAVDEIPFVLGGVIALDFTTEQKEIEGMVNYTNLTASILVTEITTTVTPEQATVVEGC